MQEITLYLPLSARRRGPRRQKTATLTIHATERVPLANVPAGARFKGYRRYVVQELEIRVQNTCFLLEQWQLPTGEYVTAPVPLAVQGGHYGPQLVSYVLHQYYHAHVNQPLLLEQLHEWGIEISAGQLNHLLTEGHERFHGSHRRRLAGWLSQPGSTAGYRAGQR